MIILVFLLVVQIIILLFFICKSIQQRKIFQEEDICFDTTVNSFTDIDVIIAAKENLDIIVQCIDNVMQSGFSSIILCLDGCDSSFKSSLSNLYPSIIIIHNEKQEGKIKSQLKCLRLSKKLEVLILDADILLFAEEVNHFVSYFHSHTVDFLCPYSMGFSSNMNTFLFRIAEIDRYMRQRIIRAGRDAYGVSNLSGYCVLAKKT